MRKIIPVVLLLLTLNAGASPADSLTWGVFGKVFIYRPADPPTSVVLFVSGDGGWNLGVVGMAKILNSMGAFVAGIDIRTYYRNLLNQNVTCYYPASDFENLSIYLQKKYKLPGYRKPILAGYSSGATLVYALLVQAPANTFKGAISLGFCPDIEINKPLCEGSGLQSHVIKPGISYYLEPDTKLSAPWIALHGTIDQVCDQKHTTEFISKTGNASMIVLPKVGHGFSVEKNWVPQFREAFTEIMGTVSLFEKNRQTPPSYPEMKALYAKIESLPVTVYPANQKENEKMVVMISGDGGWTSWDHSLADEFSRRGFPVAGLDAQKYFWERKNPETVTDDIQNIITYYQRLWNCDSFILVGYSFGADIIPFVVNRLDPDFVSCLSRVAMLSPDPKADFEIHVSDMFEMGNTSDVYDVIAELKKIKEDPEMICIFGESEEASDIQPFRLPFLKIHTIPGSHHYKDDFPLITETILK